MEPTAGSPPPPAHDPAPGAAGHRRARVHWELVSCGFGGHVLVGTAAAEVTPADHMLVRESGGMRWYRCLRCDMWSASLPPAAPSEAAVPAVDDIELPPRGRALRDRFVLRLIAAEKVLHVAVVALLAAGIFLFAAHRRTLRGDYTRVLNDFQTGLGGPAATHHGLLADLDKLFALSQEALYLIGVGLIAYGVILAAEVVGLWFARRWAEYLAFVETLVFIPYSVYELSAGVSALKVLTLVVNVAILLYLVIVHRLFGIRGGARATVEDTSAREAFERATPSPAAGPPATA